MPRWLLATDGSPTALRAAAYAAALAHDHKQVEITLLHVQEDPLRPLTVASAGPDDIGLAAIPESVIQSLEESAQQRAQWALDQTEVTFRSAGIPVARRAERGSPRERICQIAEQEGYDLIIIGSRGLGELQGLLLGSVSHHVAQHAACPVLLVR